MVVKYGMLGCAIRWLATIQLTFVFTENCHSEMETHEDYRVCCLLCTLLDPYGRNLAKMYGELGTALLTGKQAKLAAKAFQEGLQSNLTEEGRADMHMGLGASYLMMGRHEEAIQVSKEALRFNPDWPIPHLTIGLSFAVLGDKKSALAEYNILKDLDRGMADQLFKTIYP